MRLLAFLFLIVGVALGGGAAYVAYQQLEQQRAAAVEPAHAAPQLVSVVAANSVLNYGDELTYDKAKTVLKFVKWPVDAVPEDAFKTAEALFGEKKDQSRIVTRTIEPGELLLKPKLTGFGESVRIATRVREGMRAFTIPINAVTGTAGLISPGDFVDILYIRRDKEGQMSSHILLQKILVVATDQQTGTRRTGGRLASTATVEVTREDAQRLTLAMQAGSLSLLLRGVEETTTTTEGLSFDSTLLPGAEKKEPEVVVKEVEVIKEVEVVKEVETKAPEPVDNSYKIRVRKGSAVSEERFE